MFYAKEEMEPIRQDDFEARIVAALEHAPAAPPPAEFAAHVAHQLPAPRRHTRHLHVGRTASALAAVMLLALILWLAPRATASFLNLAFDLELLAITVLALLAWLLPRHWREV
ncbi:MAG: hypothetical protein PW792_02410 [Acidobacteriaceae bacterium]|nr:hypothetical protein [Acidobacteriaceae bacterium]